MRLAHYARSSTTLPAASSRYDLQSCIMPKIARRSRVTHRLGWNSDPARGTQKGNFSWVWCRAAKPPTVILLGLLACSWGVVDEARSLKWSNEMLRLCHSRLHCDVECEDEVFKRWMHGEHWHTLRDQDVTALKALLKRHVARIFKLNRSSPHEFPFSQHGAHIGK